MEREEKQSNFKRIAENRLGKILDLVDSFENYLNKDFYQYSDEQINKMCQAIIDAVEEKRRMLIDRRRKGVVKSRGDGEIKSNAGKRL